MCSIVLTPLLCLSSALSAKEALASLHLELVYQSYPLIWVVVLLYVASATLTPWRGAAVPLLLMGWLTHTFLLLLRIYILGRPPVANMYETLLFVPWVAMGCTMASRWHMLQWSVALTSALMLSCAVWASPSGALEHIQPVLDSHFWLTIHVIMIVSSYAFFLLAALLGHGFLFFPRDSLTTPLLKAMYVGLVLLIPGTILGGLWASHSWGRFWDWDPKEAWAFITACCYLVVLHAHRYRLIGPYGLALGAIVGGWAASFTWYGVNFIIASGLHSYGFGEGYAINYAIALALDAALVLTIMIIRPRMKAEG